MLGMKKQSFEAQYKVLEVSEHRIVILDLDGEDSPTVTNDAHGVVDRLLRDYGYIPGRRIFYRDTLSRFDELHVADGKFQGFKACTLTLRAELDVLYRKSVS